MLALLPPGLPTWHWWFTVFFFFFNYFGLVLTFVFFFVFLFYITNYNQKPTELSDGEPELVRPSDNPAMVLIFKHKAQRLKIGELKTQPRQSSIRNNPIRKK